MLCVDAARWFWNTSGQQNATHRPAPISEGNLTVLPSARVRQHIFACW